MYSLITVNIIFSSAAQVPYKGFIPCTYLLRDILSFVVCGSQGSVKGGEKAVPAVQMQKVVQDRQLTGPVTNKGTS